MAETYPPQLHVPPGGMVRPAMYIVAFAAARTHTAATTAASEIVLEVSSPFETQNAERTGR